MVKQKKGWVRITEAFIAVLIIVSVMILVIGGDGRRDNSSDINIYEFQKNLLQEIQLNNTLRNEILSTSAELNLTDFPNETKEKINSSIPTDIECDAKLCDPSSACTINELQENNVYTEFVLISSNLTTYNHRMLRLFCWD